MGADAVSAESEDDATAQFQIAKLLLSARADPNHVNSNMTTLRDHCKCKGMSAEMEQLLDEHGALHFEDAKLQVESHVNTRLYGILQEAFLSESAAFVGRQDGGVEIGAGTAISTRAQRGLYAAAA